MKTMKNAAFDRIGTASDPCARVGKQGKLSHSIRLLANLKYVCILKNWLNTLLEISVKQQVFLAMHFPRFTTAPHLKYRIILLYKRRNCQFCRNVSSNRMLSRVLLLKQINQGVEIIRIIVACLNWPNKTACLRFSCLFSLPICISLK